MAFRFLCQVLIYFFWKVNGKLDDQRVCYTVALAALLIWSLKNYWKTRKILPAISIWIFQVISYHTISSLLHWKADFKVLDCIIKNELSSKRPFQYLGILRVLIGPFCFLIRAWVYFFSQFFLKSTHFPKVFGKSSLFWWWYFKCVKKKKKCVVIGFFVIIHTIMQRYSQKLVVYSVNWHLMANKWLFRHMKMAHFHERIEP